MIFEKQQSAISRQQSAKPKAKWPEKAPQLSCDSLIELHFDVCFQHECKKRGVGAEKIGKWVI
jgi:hypothetical protein